MYKNVIKIQRWYRRCILRHQKIHIIAYKNIVKIQKWYRGCILRLKRLPLIMYKIQECLKLSLLSFFKQNNDGRINSCFDEENIIKILQQKYKSRIQKPKSRMWYDILVFDNYYHWIPVNIKTTTTLTCDNTGNLAMCVYAYSDEKLILSNTYNNGHMSDVLLNKMINKEINKKNKKDYYFVVINKNNASDVIINSVKGLSIITPNANNLPFQVCWNKNRIFTYECIQNKINMFLHCIKKKKTKLERIFL